jgi:dienelactone hydrolase
MRSLTIHALVLYFCSSILSSAYAAQHYISSATNASNGAITLTLAGSAPTDARAYYDYYLIQTSDTLAKWSLLTTLLRTNSLTSALRFTDQPSTPSRFYRAAAGPFPTPFVMPSGKFAVGSVSLRLDDASRSNRYNVATNSSFMITLWYPARPTADGIPSSYVESRLAPTFAAVYSVSSTLLSNFRACVYESADFARETAPCPGIIYSHGFRVSRRDNTSNFQELASHGYVVVAIDHSDTLATELPDGRVLATSITSLSQSLFDNNVADVRFVLAALTELNATDLRFKDAFGLQNIGTMGWSYGGGVAAEICRTDPRVKATALLEAYLQNARDVAFAGVQKPVLGLYNATSFFTTPYDQTTADAYWMRIQGSDHQTFADWHGWIYAPTAATRAASTAIKACVLSFFDKHLRGVDDHLLDDPSANFPQITGFMKK